MPHKIQVRRGQKSQLPQLDSGEFGLAQDTEELFIGTGTENIQLSKQADLDSVKSDLAESQNQLSDIAIYARNFKNPNETDWGTIINRAISSISRGKVILPAGDLTLNTSIIQKSNIIIEGQGVDITVLKPIDCHGITVAIDQYLRFAGVKDLTISGNNGGVNSTYDNTKHGINWNSGNKETYQCFIERVRVANCYGKGVYVPYDFNNIYDSVFVSKCGGNGIEIRGMNSSTLRSCYVDYVADGKAGYRVYENAVLISCNGTGGGTADYWGVFGRDNGQFEDSSNGQLQYGIIFIGCNIEDWRKTGCVFLFAGSFQFIGTTFYAPSSGTYDYFIDAKTINKMSVIDGSTKMQSKGATSTFPSMIKSNITNPLLLVYNGISNFTTDGTTVVKIPRISSVYDSYLQGALEFEYMNIKGMSYYYHGGKKHSTGSAMPTTGTYNQGDYVKNTSPTVQGTAGSKYVIRGWIRITTGSTHVLNTDWVEDRSLTGQ